jgi:hypothetical protein
MENHKFSVCGGSECELGQQCKNTCKDCYFPVDGKHYHGDCPSIKSHKVISLQDIKESNMEMNEKLKALLGSPNCIAFWFDESGNVAYANNGLSNPQMAYASKIFQLMTDDQFRHTIKWSE